MSEHHSHHHFTANHLNQKLDVVAGFDPNKFNFVIKHEEPSKGTSSLKQIRVTSAAEVDRYLRSLGIRPSARLIDALEAEADEYRVEGPGNIHKRVVFY